MTAILHRAARAASDYDWLLVLLAAPALLFPSPARSLALLLIVAAWAGRWAATGTIITRTPLDGAILLVLFMTLISLGATYSLEASLPKVTGIVLGVAGYYVLARRLSASRAFNRGLWAYVLAGAAFAGVGLLGTDWLSKFPILDRVIGRLPGLIRGLPGVEEGLQPNYVAGALVLFLPVQLALLAATPRNRRQAGRAALLAVLAALTALTLVLTQSRGAMVGLAAGLALWLAWHGPRARRLLLAILAVALAGAVIAAAVLGPERAWAEAQAAAGRYLAANVRGRFELWSRALTAIQAFPLTGLGLNVFRQAVPVLFPLFTAAPNFDVAHAHNQFLQAALDLGLPGLAAFAALAVGAFAMLARARRAPPSRRLLAEGFAAALAAQLVFGLTDAIAFGARVHIFFWAALACCACLHFRATDEAAA
jgi:putative inorganic carbon (HCO3(-)) transporter